MPSTGRWNANAASNQVSRSHGSTGSFEVTDPQILDDAMGFNPRLAGAMTIRPGGPAQSGAGRRSMEGSLHRSATQESMTASTSGPAWLEMSHDLRAQRAKEVLLQVLHRPLSLLLLVLQTVWGVVPNVTHLTSWLESLLGALSSVMQASQ